MKKQEKNIILFIGNAFNSNIDDVENFEKSQKRKFRTAIITSCEFNLNRTPSQQGVENRFDFILRCDTKSINDIKKVISPIKDEILIVFCYFESWMLLYSKLVRLLPDVNMPTAKSLKICNSKLEMRKKFIKYYPEITPKFMLVDKSQNVEKIAKEIGFPCITKPLNFSKSRLIIKSDNIKELKNNLKYTFSKIEKVYKQAGYESNSMILAEEYMEGDLYSIDAYISPNGKIYLTPIVRVVTGKDIGIDDFFNYYRITPAEIKEEEEKRAQKVATKSIKATGITSATVHIELMKVRNGNWKIIEIQSRPGGYRDEMLKLSFGIKHHINDFLNKIEKKPIIYRKVNSYTAVIEIFPEEEGEIFSIKGINKMKKMKSFLRYKQIKKIGEMCGYSRDGYTYVLRVVLNHINKNILHKDLKKIKDIIKIELK